MFSEVNTQNQGRRYFGRDITNIEENVPQNQSILYQKGHENLGLQKMNPRENHHRRISSNFTHNNYLNNVKQNQGGESAREYYPGAAKLEDNRYAKQATRKNANITPIHQLKNQNKMDVETLNESPFKYPKPRANESNEKPRILRPTKNSHRSPMRVEKLEMIPFESYPNSPFIIKDQDSVYKYNKQMNFPGNDFLDIRGIPFSYIWSHLIFKKSDNICRSLYMDLQTDITKDMYEIVIDWLVDVHRKFKMKSETLFLCIAVMNKYLETNNIRKEIFQLVSTACMLIASKYEEIYPPPIEDFIYICADAYTKNEFVQMEAMILSDVSFNLVISNQSSLLGIYGLQSKSILITRML